MVTDFKIYTPEGMEPDPGAVEQMRTCMQHERAVGGALMADHHKGYSMPIGGVIAYEGAVSPSGVGFDIGCGNMAVRSRENLDLEGLPKMMKRIHEEVAFGLGRRMEIPIEDRIFDHATWDIVEQYCPKGLKEIARAQLGTVGTGNHYVDILVDVGDEKPNTWIANHMGSRAFGHKVATSFLNLAKGDRCDAKFKETETPTVLPLDQDLGQAYLRCMELAGHYAILNRGVVMDQTLKILELDRSEIDMMIKNHHNYSWNRMDSNLHVVRKGATPIHNEYLSYIGGSMGEGAAIVRARRDFDSKDEIINSYMSAPHGAGRVMSRAQAAGKWVRGKDAAGKKVRYRNPETAHFDYPTEIAKLRAQGITVLGGAADEVPGVYKSLEKVLEAHSYIEVLHWLRPLGVVMAEDD